MEFIPRNPVLKFNTDQLNMIRKQYNFEKPGDMDKAIDVLEAWVKEQRHFKKKDFPRSYLERTIITSKGSLERAKNKLDKICTIRTMMPDFFGENLMNIRFGDLQPANINVIPKPTENNDRIYLLKVTGSKFSFELLRQYYRSVILLLEYLFAHDYCNGLIIIVDYSEANMTELIKAHNLKDLRQMAIILLEGFGMRIKGMHLITPSKSINILVSIFKQLLSDKIGKRIYVHEDTSTLFQHVPKDMFPVDYGGKEKSLLELQDALLDEITGKEFMNYIEEMNKATTDESLRQSETFNEHYLGMPGSFRTFNVD